MLESMSDEETNNKKKTAVVMAVMGILAGRREEIMIGHKIVERFGEIDFAALVNRRTRDCVCA